LIKRTGCRFLDKTSALVSYRQDVHVVCARIQQPNVRVIYLLTYLKAVNKK